MGTKKLSRREFIRLTAVGGASALVAACAPEVIRETVEVTRQVPVEVERVVTPTPEPELAFPAGTTLSIFLRNNWVPGMNQVQENQARLWGEAHGVTMEVAFGNQREQSAAAAESGAGSDIYDLFQNDALVYAEKLEDLSEICEEVGVRYGGWYDVGRQVCVADGVWKAIPRYYTAHTVNYRVDYFGQAGVEGVPRTYDDLLVAGRKLKDAGLPLLAFPVSQAAFNDSANWLYSALWSFGGKEVEEDGRTVAINSQETRDAIDYIVALAEVSAPDITAYDDGSNNRNFLAGQISATNNAASIYNRALASAPDVAENMDHFRYPEGPAGHHQFVEMNTLALFSYSRSKDPARAWMSWMMDEGQFGPLLQFGFTFASPLLPYFEELPNMPWNIYPKLASFKQLARDGHVPGWPGPASRKAGEAFNRQIIVNMFASVVLGEEIDRAVELAEEGLVSIYGG